jgi:catechol 2,3-dioxygenase-like lactoylglutathione lyase family enzyme
MTTVNVRYMVGDVEAAVAFYTTYLGFTLISKTAPAFARRSCLTTHPGIRLSSFNLGASELVLLAVALQ